MTRLVYSIDRRLAVYLKPRLLILGEVGYLPLDPLDAANLFRLVQERCERGVAMIVTSNITFGEWGRFLGDPGSPSRSRPQHQAAR